METIDRSHDPRSYEEFRGHAEILNRSPNLRALPINFAPESLCVIRSAFYRFRLFSLLLFFFLERRSQANQRNNIAGEMRAIDLFYVKHAASARSFVEIRALTFLSFPFSFPCVFDRDTRRTK